MADEQINPFSPAPETHETSEVPTESTSETEERHIELNREADLRESREKTGKEAELAEAEAQLAAAETSTEKQEESSTTAPDKKPDDEEKKGLLGGLLKGGAIGGISASIAKFGEFFKKISEFLGPLRELIARSLAPALEAMTSNNEAIETAKKWGFGLGTLGVFPGLKLFMGKYADFYKGISRHKITITDEKSSAKKFIEIYKKGVADGMNDNFVDFFKLVARETSSAKGDARKVTMGELESYANKAVGKMQEGVAETKTPPAPTASETTKSEPERIG